MAIKGVFCRGYHTETAATAITEVIPGNSSSKARVERLVYRVAGTAHTLTLMRPIAVTTTENVAQSGQTTITVEDAQPGKDSSGAAETLAANDWLAWQDENGVWKHDSVSSISGKDVVVSTALSVRIATGTTIYCFYEVGRASHRTFNPGTSVTREYETNFQGGISTHVDRHNTRSGVGDPLILPFGQFDSCGIS